MAIRLLRVFSGGAWHALIDEFVKHMNRTIKHMLFLQSVITYADSIKQADEPKKNKETDPSSNGATWAYEFGNQTMGCALVVSGITPSLVAIISPPSQTPSQARPILSLNWSGLKRKGLRIVVTGGAGFVRSHLVDRLIARGDSVIVVDNFFTVNKDHAMHHLETLDLNLFVTTLLTHCCLKSIRSITLRALC